VVCREDRITKLIPQKLLSVREAIHAALQEVMDHRVETAWSMSGVIPGDPDWAGGTVFHDDCSGLVTAPAASVFRAVCLLGGQHGWHSANWLWKIRGGIDVFAGGPGLRRGRRHPEQLAYGEALDFWRVIGIERDRNLTLRAEMKLPGEATIAFQIVPNGPNECTLRQLATFRPRGLMGLLYWYAVLPFHNFVFQGMFSGIEREALQIASASTTAR
jgi:hypothetical protein